MSSSRPVKNRHLGFCLDGVLLAVCAFLVAQRLGGSRLWTAGVPAVLASLPSPAGNATAAAPAPAAYFEYLLGEDLGAGAGGEAAYFHAVNAWKNGLLLPAPVRAVLPHTAQIWARNMLAGWLLYFGVGFAWAAWIFWARGEACFPGGRATMPSWPDMRAQMAVSARAMVVYSLAPTVGEWAVERGWTLAYHDPARAAAWLGLPGAAAPAAWLCAAALLAGYMLLVEWGIYWIHRYLHDNRALYKLLHKTHHIYNNEGSLSPFAGLAFHPVDGLLQAAPYGLLLLLLPVNFWAYEGLLFFTAIWTTNIHDTLEVDTEPVMGSKYHTVHHTTYRDNYGQLFILFDWLHDTLTLDDATRAGKAAPLGSSAAGKPAAAAEPAAERAPATLRRRAL